MGIKIPAVGVATAVFGVLLIVGAWLYTLERVRTERAEAVTSEFSKNANLALALDVQTNQLLRGIDQFLLVIKSQHEQPGVRMPLKELAAPVVVSSAQRVTFIGVTDERGDVIESVQEFTATNIADREFFQSHQRDDSRALVISSPILGRISGRWAITLTRRVNKPDGTFGGIVAISIEPQYLTELFEHTTLGSSDVMSLVLANGDTLARRRGTQIEFGENIAKSQLIVEHAKRPSGNFIGRGGVDGQLRVFSYRTMKDYPVIATVGTSATDAFALVERRARTYYLTASLASAFIALACAVGFVMLARQQRANRQLGEQASLLDKAQDAIMVSDVNRRLTYWNKGAERLYGWTAGEAIGRIVSELFYGNVEPEESRTAYDQVLRLGEWTGELQPLNKSGRRVIIESRWTLVRDEQGRAQGILSINTDVTERRELEQQFLRAQRLESIGTLAGGIAHDLNNVLTPIMLGAEMLKRDVTDPGGREVLETVCASARRGAEMVQQVLSFARGMEGRRTDLDVKDLVAGVARIARDTMPKNIDLKTRVEDGLPALYGDPTQFHQVLLNLCVNARDAMPRGGLLTIAAERDTHPRDRTDVPAGAYVMLQVEDTGTGIQADVADKIFDPFFTTKEPGKGTGLGLSTSLTIVKSHGGHIRASSVPGRGASFRIYLPVSAGPGIESAPVAAADLPKGAGETVLVVDDEPAIRLIAQRTLESRGYRVLLAADGAEAIATFRTQYQSIGLVMLDMTMPVLDGVPTIQALARIDPTVRIIAISGIHANEQAARAASPRVTQFIPKPFTAEMLLKAIQQALA